MKFHLLDRDGLCAGIKSFGFLYLLRWCKTVWFGIVMTILFSLGTVFAEQNLFPAEMHVPFDLYYTGIIGQIVMFAGIFTAALLLSNGEKLLPNLILWTQGK